MKKIITIAIAFMLVPTFASAAQLNDIQIGAIIGLLQAFGVNQTTIAMVQSDLEPQPMATVTHVTYQAPTQTVALPPVYSAPVVSAPAPVIVTTPAPTEIAAAPAPEIVSAPAPVIPEVTISQVSISALNSDILNSAMLGTLLGESVLTVGNDPIEFHSTTITLNGRPIEIHDAQTSVNNGTSTFVTVTRTTNTQWVATQDFTVPAGGTLTVDIYTVDNSTEVAQVAGYTATDLTTGATITQ